MLTTAQPACLQRSPITPIDHAQRCLTTGKSTSTSKVPLSFTWILQPRTRGSAVHPLNTPQLLLLKRRLLVRLAVEVSGRWIRETDGILIPLPIGVRGQVMTAFSLKHYFINQRLPLVNYFWVCRNWKAWPSIYQWQSIRKCSLRKLLCGLP